MDPAQLQPGYRLDRYELLCPLAYGGMASVWLARFGGRLGFERLVVVKMILPQYSQDPRFQEMFLDEANIASKIEHTNVARILDIGEHDGNYFIVMEWVDGDSLSKVVRAAEARKQRVPAGVALRICADAAAGLHAAHSLRDRDGSSLGVVHRDVSPQNILISNAGATVLIDFGVAKARDRVAQETSAGQLKGKIRYMAPEQALGENVDHRADIWSLGSILYELFSGSPPYEGANEVATLHKLTSGAPPPPLPAHTPRAVAAIIERALAHEAQARFDTALELSLALERAIVELGEAASTAIVAHYTGQLLAERKAARKKAVDAALVAARGRDLRPSDTPPMASRPMPALTPEPPPFVGPRATLPLAEALVSMTGTGVPADAHQMGLGEVPSATSSATLGSAAIEYSGSPSDCGDPNDLAMRRRKLFAAAALGVSLAAGVVGAVLIVSTAIMRRSADRATAGAATATATATAQPPPEPSETPSAASPPAAAAEPAQAPAASAPAAASSTPATSPPAGDPKPSASAATSATATHASSEPPAATHTASRPPTPPVVRPPPPRPAPAPPATTSTAGKKDYGF
jgi:serine/threonine-protein kinase